jgi:hypothetical protein
MPVPGTRRTVRVMCNDPHVLHEKVGCLLAQARHFRTEARRVHPVLGRAYLRRASELQLTAWVQAARLAPVDVDDVVGAAAA